jgi:alkylation response protein AidB-like acyl-CoA dehydrogenase
VGAPGDGWKVAGATLSGERQMVSGAGSGGVDRIGGSGADALVALARRTGGSADRVARQRVVALWSEERIRAWTNARVRAGLKAGRSPGPESSVGKVHQGDLNQRMQLMACDLLGPASIAWEGEGLPREVKGMLRSRANTIEGGTTEVNRNVVGERVLGLPREPDPWSGRPWKDVPRS